MINVGVVCALSVLFVAGLAVLFTGCTVRLHERIEPTLLPMASVVLFGVSLCASWSPTRARFRRGGAAREAVRVQLHEFTSAVCCTLAVGVPVVLWHIERLSPAGAILATLGAVMIYASLSLYLYYF